MKKNKNFEIIEESRFLSKENMDESKGGVDGGIVLPCLIGKKTTCADFFFTTCTRNKNIYCGPNPSAANYTSCSIILGNKTCEEVYENI